jgi:hypothetical protein
MQAIVRAFGALLVLTLAASAAPAQYYHPCVPRAPDARGPGFYCPNYCGLIYGPNYCLQPPFPPFQGMVLPPCPPSNSPLFPTHPFARGPRDYFMDD